MASPGGRPAKDPLDKYRLGAPDSDARALRSRRIKRFAIIAAAVVAVAFAAGWNPPTTGSHTFTNASDYKPSSDSGCTNSGKGCHGSESAYADFNAYHPDATCTTCHAYQGVGCIPCHTPGNLHECPVCHDGSLDAAPDRVRITDPYPRGHYRETSHTAISTNMDAQVRSAPEGQAAASCSDCHAADLRGAHTGVQVAEDSSYSSDMRCAECHNDQRSFGLTQVLHKWKGRKCEDCHTTDASTPMHSAKVAEVAGGTGALGCGDTGSGCHPRNDLHLMHADVPQNCSSTTGSVEPACHNLDLEAHVPTSTACGGDSQKVCHSLYITTDYSHEHDRDVHSATVWVPAGDTSYFGTPCGSCHRMAPDGTSLVVEHALPTSSRSLNSRNDCLNCHNSLASAWAIGDDWSYRNGTNSCDACHGSDGLPAAHMADLTSLHSPGGSAGCASTGPGCHPTSDLAEVGEPTTDANIHRDCLSCHDWRRSDGNMAYDPSRKTCGQGRTCHAGAGAYKPATGVHDGAAGLADGTDRAHHQAGITQGAVTLTDPVAGTTTPCESCHSMTLLTEHARPGASLATGSGTLCTRCHDHSIAVAEVVKASWPGRQCSACHPAGSTTAAHAGIGFGHVAIERDPTGAISPGSCVKPGCHSSTDLRRLHRFSGCTTTGCHSAIGDISSTGIASCGGLDAATSCHVGYSATNHFVDHSADLIGTVNGVTYRVGENGGCFGCHFTDLVSEHSTAVVAGSMEGGGSTSCAVCHADADDPTRNTYASLPAVLSAVENHDLRCSACHASGSNADGPDAVASAHKDVSAASVLPPGKVWSDPFEEWKAALDSPMGGGHNSLPADVVGASADRQFPLETLAVGATTYTWALPPNSGPTTWLRASVFGTAAVSTPDAIRQIEVTCDDCHSFGGALAGPHGAAVVVNIDPDYSQTEYSNPTPIAFQFSATGTNRVVCFKCHNLETGSVPGTTAPGGNRAHALHVKHSGFPPYNPNYFGEKCVDCHVRIPHAWRHPRLLARTVVTTDGVPADTFPYVRRGYDGLAGIRLRSFVTTTDLAADSCVTGGCFGPRTPTNHPMSSDVPTSAYWP